MKNLVLFVALASIVIVMSCGDGNVVIVADPEIQAAEDSITIVNYLADLGYEGDEVGVLESGVRYVILDSGNVDRIDESDIVSFLYTGRLTNDTIFDTASREVADSIRMAVEANITEGDTTTTEFALLASFSEDRDYEALTYTYSGSGWTIEGLFINGFSEGISATFDKMGVGGTSLIAIPSGEGYGTSGSGFLIPPDAVLLFELSPSEVIKQ